MSEKKCPQWIGFLFIVLAKGGVWAAPPLSQVDLDPPTLVTLHAKGATLGDVVADVVRQTGVPIAVSSGFFTSTSDSPLPPITLDLQRVPFWTAMAAICDQTDTEVRDNPAGYNTHLQIADAFGEKFLGGPVDHCGLFTVEIESIWLWHIAKLIPGTNAPKVDDEVCLNIYIDPKAKVSSMDAICLTEATDDRGQSLLPAEKQPVPFISDFDLLLQPRCPLNIHADGATKITRLRGSMDISMTASGQRIEIPDVSAATHLTETLGRLVFQINSISAPGRAATVELTLREKNNDNENEAIERLLRQITLTDASGQVMTAIGQARWIGDGDVCSYQATFIGQRKLQGPIKFAWSIPDAIAKITVPFEFNDIALPAP